MFELPEKTVFLIPVYNEADNIRPLYEEILAGFPSADVCFINDGSTDDTLKVLRSLACRYLSLPCNLGVGGAMQSGFQHAYDLGYEYAIRLDGDGQHPPQECAKLAKRLAQGDVDMVVGSRFLGHTDYSSSWYRQVGITVLAWLLSMACRRTITDPTSGFQMVNRSVMYYFANLYPSDYPEPEALALLSRQGFSFCEVSVSFRPRLHGASTIRTLGSIYYLFKVSVALFADRCRAVDPQFDRHHLKGLA